VSPCIICSHTKKEREGEMRKEGYTRAGIHKKVEGE